MVMDFKYMITSSFALFGFIASVFGVSTFITSTEASTPLSPSVSDLDSSKENFQMCSNSSDTFAQDESQVIAIEYTKAGTAECLFVGCGGII